MWKCHDGLLDEVQWFEGFCVLCRPKLLDFLNVIGLGHDARP